MCPVHTCCASSLQLGTTDLHLTPLCRSAQVGASMKLYLRLYRETVWYCDNKELLVYCVTCVQTVVLLITCRIPVLPTLTSNMKVSTSSLISSSVRGSPFCDVCSSKSRKFMCRLLPRIKEDNHVLYPSFTRAFVCVCIHRRVCIYTSMYMVTTLLRLVVTICTTSLTFSNPTFCLNSCIYVFCVDLRTNSDYFPININ